MCYSNNEIKWLKKITMGQTENLILRTVALDFISKIIDEDNSAYEDIGVNKTEGWPEEALKEVLPIIKENLLKGVPDKFQVWLFIEKATNTIVGSGGFKGCPNECGEIDLGYGIAEEHRKKGYGFEGAKALLQWAFTEKEVQAVTASCLKTNEPSNKILNKLQMKQIKEDKEYYYFEMRSLKEYALLNEERECILNKIKERGSVYGK